MAQTEKGQVWSPDNVRDVAESVGIASLNKDVVDHLARDVEYRICLVLEEALKFMRHSRRTVLSTQDISQALRVLDLEPLYGYESTRPLRFGEASIGPGQPLYYVEDEEVDFEKLINAPLPKVPREISFTAHWLAVEGVQPSIPQNPVTDASRHDQLTAKGPGTNPNLAAASGADNVSVKPLVKHILSKELQLYFDNISAAILDQTNDEYRNAAYASLRTDPGLHQLVPYFVQFIAEKVTHSLKDLFTLHQMLSLTSALLDNPHLYIDPYISPLVPPVLTCLTGKRLGPANGPDPLAHFQLRDVAASLLTHIATKYARSMPSLKTRLARTLLKKFLDPTKPFGVHYGALLGLSGLAGADGVRTLIVPNLPAYNALLREGLEDESRKAQAGIVVQALMGALATVEREETAAVDGVVAPEDARGELAERVGDVLAGRLVMEKRERLISGLLQSGAGI